MLAQHRESLTFPIEREEGRNMKKLISGAAIIALALGGVIVATSAASATPPDHVCTEPGYETKVNTVGDPATVDVTAPEGFLIDSYCVKAGTTKHIIAVDPPSATVTIDHPDKDSVSHYQVRLVPIPDEPEVPVKPEPVIYHGEWGVGEVNCDTRIVTEGRYVWTHDWTYDEATNSWVENVTGTETVETREVAATEEQCPLPDPETYLPSCTTVTGHQWIEGTGVLEVTGDWASTSIAVPFSGTLADIGTVLDIEADPIQYVGLHIDTAEGTIVFEEEPSYGGNLWSTSAWAGVDPGMGYAAFGSIEDYIHLNGDVVVTGIRLLYTSPVASSTTVESFTIGCTVYEFRTIPAQPETVVTTGEWSEVEVTCDNEPLDVIEQTRTNTMTPFVWDAEAWEWVPGETTSIAETRGYVVTSADIEALDCPVVTPEPTETPAPVAKPAAKPAALAATGGPDMTPVLWIGGALIALGSAFAVLVGMGGRRRHQYED